MIKHWTKESSKQVGDYRIFTIRSDTVRSPRTGVAHDFYVIDTVDWVNVIALTPANELVVIEQYRHGTATVELEIPGGMMDAEDVSPVATAVRELREETGYEGEEAAIIGDISPNPAIMSNHCHTILVKNCVLKHPVEFDDSEDLATRLIPVEQIHDLVYRGKIRHSLVVVALYHFDLWRRFNQPPKSII